MIIENIEYMDKNKKMIKITTEDEGTIFAQYPTQTWHQEFIDEWLQENDIQEPPAMGLEELRSEKINEIEEGLRQRFREGMEYTFPDEKPGVVQLGIDDRQNITALALRSSQLISEGLNDTEMEFRSLSNEVHSMTAEEINQMANTAMDYVSSLYKQSWNLKDAARDATKEEEIQNVSWGD